MIQHENQQWNNIEHDLFSMRFVAYVRVSDFSADQALTILEQETLATLLTNHPSTGLQRVAIDSDDMSGYTEIGAVVEAEDEAAALSLFARQLIGSWVSGIQRDPECLELVETHIAYEEDLKIATLTDPIEQIKDTDYTVEELPTFDFNEIDGQIMTDTRALFYQARAQYIES